MGRDISSRLGDVDVSDTKGQKVRLGSLWSNRPAVIIFVRHFG